MEFLDWDGTVISQTGFTNPQYVEDGKSATPPQTDPVREGYTFDGWTPDYHNVSKDLTVIAKYTDNSGDQSRHTVTFYAYEKNKMTAISVQKVNDGEAAVEPAVPTRDGYTFTGWYPDKTVFSKVTTDLTIVAAYDKNSAGAGASPSGGSSSGASASPSSTAGNNNNGDNTKKYTVSVSGGSGSGSYPAGAIVALNAYDMGVGKQFDKWTTSTAGVGLQMQKLLQQPLLCRQPMLPLRQRIRPEVAHLQARAATVAREAPQMEAPHRTEALEAIRIATAERP